MNMKFTSKDILEYLYATVSLILVFCLLSLIEIFLNFDTLELAYKILTDFFTGIFIGLLFFPLYLVLKYIMNSLGIIVIKILFSSIILIQLGLIVYNMITHINLGADLLGYSLNDLYTTVTASLSILFLSFLPFLALPIVYLGMNRLLHFYGHRISPKLILIVVFFFGSLTVVLAGSNKPTSDNKLNFLLSDIIHVENDKALSSQNNTTFKKEFPLEQSALNTKDVLAPFFNISREKPNIIFIIVEGLGSDFTDDVDYKGFMPYLDSLTSKSLYWENFVSNAGRTFGVLPSLLGSLPFGKNGFMVLNPLPKHNSLISILKSNGYTANYFCGDASSLDRKSNFLEYNGIDKIIDINKFRPGYVMTKENAGGFSWGYPDAEIYCKTLAEIKDSRQPRLDIIMTLTNHEPIDFPSKKEYLEKVEGILNTKSYLKKNKLNEYKDILSCLLYTDNSLQNFMEAYAERPDYANTIFIITGDHRLIPVPQKNNLSRFHVPFYIYSPMLKKTAKFKSISSHNDVTLSLVSFLTTNYKFNVLQKTTWPGQGLDTVREFRNIHSIPLMRYKGSINDYIYKDYFYSDGILLKIDENFNLSETNNDSRQKVSSSFLDFKNLKAYLTTKNKITNTASSFIKPTYTFTIEEFGIIKKLTKGLDPTQIFFLATDLAFKKERKKARLLCNYILNELPNYGDVRTLKGRKLTWDGDFKNAEKELIAVISRTPFYGDSYSALMDVYWWSDQNKKAVVTSKKALENQINDPELGYKLAQAYNRTQHYKDSSRMMDSLLALYPENKEYLNFKKSIKNDGKNND